MKPNQRGATAAAIHTLALGVLLTVVAPASADTPGCVTRAEYRQVQTLPRGEWTMARVARLFDTAGEPLHTRYPYSSRARAYASARSRGTGRSR
jgi:hypothetical protein